MSNNSIDVVWLELIGVDADDDVHGVYVDNELIYSGAPLTKFRFHELLDEQEINDGEARITMLDPIFCDGDERNDWFLYYAGDLPERLTDALLIITSHLNRLENDGDEAVGMSEFCYQH